MKSFTIKEINALLEGELIGNTKEVPGAFINKPDF